MPALVVCRLGHGRLQCGQQCSHPISPEEHLFLTPNDPTPLLQTKKKQENKMRFLYPPPPLLFPSPALVFLKFQSLIPPPPLCLKKVFFSFNVVRFQGVGGVGLYSLLHTKTLCTTRPNLPFLSNFIPFHFFSYCTRLSARGLPATISGKCTWGLLVGRGFFLYFLGLCKRYRVQAGRER